MCVSQPKQVFCVEDIKLYQHINNNTTNGTNITHNKMLKE